MDRDRKEGLETNSNLGVFEETAPLKKVIMWGEPGSEAVLGQLLPMEISCFQEPFDIIKAREEFKFSRQLLESKGIDVILVKDLLARMIEDTDYVVNKDLSKITSELAKKGNKYRDQYQEVVSKDKDVNLSNWPEWLTLSLRADAEEYGEKTAVALNEVLSNRDGLPLSNVLYARDQSNLLKKTFVFSSMRHEIRQPEVKLYRDALEHAGIIANGGLDVVCVGGSGRFEGGDGIVYRGDVYIGVGGRTNLEGIMQVAPSILNQGGRLFVPIDHERDSGKLCEMGAMHLDTYWMPCGENEVVVCEDEASRRELLEVTFSSGSLKTKNIGWFIDHMEKTGMEIAPLTKEEQDHFAPNFLNLGNHKAILSLKENSLPKELGERGMTVYSADLKQITKGYGGLHCMTAAIKRG